jgi:hypothetical protein
MMSQLPESLLRHASSKAFDLNEIHLAEMMATLGRMPLEVWVGG